MEKLLLFICLSVGLTACKKDASEDITRYNWILESTTVTPEMTVSGKTSTDYKSLQPKEGCFKNYTLSFLETGVFFYSSNGSLCDMVASNNTQKWTKDGDIITLKTDYTTTKVAIAGNKIVENTTITQNGKSYELTYAFIAKST